jgi:hypothetical protein
MQAVAELFTLASLSKRGANPSPPNLLNSRRRNGSYLLLRVMRKPNKEKQRLSWDPSEPALCSRHDNNDKKAGFAPAHMIHAPVRNVHAFVHYFSRSRRLQYYR